MKPEMPKLSDVVGGPAAMLDYLANAPEVTKTRNVSVTAARALLRGYAEKMCETYALGLLLQPILDTYDVYVMVNGEYASCPDTLSRDNWEAGIDDQIEALLTPYESWVTASWFGVAVIDTHLHKPKKDGLPDPMGEARDLATGFGKDMWRVLTHYYDHDDETVKPKSTGQILSACGIVDDDIRSLLGERTVISEEEEKVHTMKTLNDVMNKLYGGLTNNGAVAMPTAAQLMPLMENAIDSDDGIAVSGIKALTGDMEDVEPLRVYAMGSADAADELVEYLLNAPYEDNLSVGETVGNPDEDAEMLAMMGGAPVAASPVTLPPPPPPSTPVATVGAPPPPVAPPKKGKGPVEGEVPPRVFQLMKQFIKAKDEDVGKALGVSRQTYINYGKDNAKAKYVPTEEQRSVLIKLIADHRDGLSEALSLLGAV